MEVEFGVRVERGDGAWLVKKASGWRSRVFVERNRNIWYLKRRPDEADEHRVFPSFKSEPNMIGGAHSTHTRAILALTGAAVLSWSTSATEAVGTILLVVSNSAAIDSQ